MPNETHENKNPPSASPDGSEITDTQRLDWLIKQGPPGACEGIGLNSDCWDNAYCQESSDDRDVVRRAIDEEILRRFTVIGSEDYPPAPEDD